MVEISETRGSSRRYHRNLDRAIVELDKLTLKLDVSDSIEEDAFLVFQNILDKNLVTGRSILVVAAASLYVACRLTQTPRSLHEIVDVFFEERQKERYYLTKRAYYRRIKNAYNMILRELEIKTSILKPEIFISRIASKIGINVETQREATKILHRAKEKNIVAGKDPRTMASAALYIACIVKREREIAERGIIETERKTQKEIAHAAGVTEVSLRNRYQELCSQLFGL